MSNDSMKKSKEWNSCDQLFLNHRGERELSSSGRRYFTRGGVKFALLELLQGEPMHGYQMMKHLEEQSGGTYKPSAGSIYPTLQMLRDQGYVSSSKQDGKKIFEITEEGCSYLQEERTNFQEAEEKKKSVENRGNAYEEPTPFEQESMEEERDCDVRRRNRRLTPAGKELLHLMKAAERVAMEDDAKAVKLKEALNKLRDSLREITGGM
ncbi:PadR family transcriptional regulator [Paenibacillus sp. L3-i20]|uniref:PadR family transcriptional regulator n=1 Tax=Paenibacillus sp. L3-i20 TaxID=2905833 RepID=UPI001EDF9594|nr:PadR family transcriptional regulator [Paenibacillus sp. L3-i20]GKU75938.1 hypothetical protein L3i20_v203350 [Paenibacillus sp. L3-i20]